MRVYLPATAADLAGDDGLTPRWVHAVTPGLRAALPEEDDEGLELVATLAAADDSVRLLAGTALPPRRVVIAADVAPEEVAAAGAGGGQHEDADRLPSALRLTGDVRWADVAAILADEEAAEPEVRAAADGDEAALDRAAERDLLWYDVTERAALRAELGR